MHREMGWWNFVQCSYHIRRSEPCGWCLSNLATLIDALYVHWKNLLMLSQLTPPWHVTSRAVSIPGHGVVEAARGSHAFAGNLLDLNPVLVNSLQLFDSGFGWESLWGEEGKNREGGRYRGLQLNINIYIKRATPPPCLLPKHHTDGMKWMNGKIDFMSRVSL